MRFTLLLPLKFDESPAHLLIRSDGCSGISPPQRTPFHYNFILERAGNVARFYLCAMLYAM